jgi:dTDP-4-dehydrorhamnose reductase
VARILLFGKDGQLGRALVPLLAQVNQVTSNEVIALGRVDADFAEADAYDSPVRTAIRDVRPGLIVNAAAYTAVDKAESEPDLAMRINAVSVGALGEAAAEIGARVLHYSTDYVFDGAKQTPYVETDATGPLNVYGESKLAGEDALLGSGAEALILRTSWVYAASGSNFVQTMLRLGSQPADLRIVDDQVGAPTSAEDLAVATVEILQKWHGERGVFHVTASGSVSWAGFAREIFLQAGLSVNVVPISTSEYPTAAQRPRNSRLDCTKAAAQFGVTLPDWRDGLRQVLAQEKT